MSRQRHRTIQEAANGPPLQRKVPRAGHFDVISHASYETLFSGRPCIKRHYRLLAAGYITPPVGVIGIFTAHFIIPRPIFAVLTAQAPRSAFSIYW